MTLSDSGAAPAARVERPSAARDRILDTADRLFYAEGIRAVGIHRLVDESRVTRVTLYRHFPTKDELVAAYLRRRAEYDRQQVTAVIAAHDDDPREALRALARLLVENGFRDLHRGCPFVNAAAEFADTAHPVRLVVTEHRAWFVEVTEALMRRLGDPRPAATARLLMMLRTGAVMGAALDESDDLGADFLAAIDRVLDTVVIRSQPAGGATP
jgi:AcrR family transcriptional regulator